MGIRLSRRPGFRGVLCLLASFSVLAACANADAPTGAGIGPRHVILVIGDGMGPSTEVAASRFLHGVDEGLPWDDWPYAAWVATWDVTTYASHYATALAAGATGLVAWSESGCDPLLGYDPAKAGLLPWPRAGAPDDATARSWLISAATDSAAAATAMACGGKTLAGRIAWSAASPGAALQTIAERARILRGLAIGVVSTVPFNHATPAAFVAHSGARSDYADLAAQIIGSTRPDVVIGGGHPDWCATYFGQAALASLRADPRWLLAERKAGVDGTASLKAAAAALSTGQGLFGLYGGADGSFEAPAPTGTVDGSGAPEFTRDAENPGLAAAAVTACEVLSRDPAGFFLMVEQGDVDWANHNGDLRRMLGAMASLDETVRAIEAFVDQPGDGIDWDNTILIVTADHSTGLPRFPASSMIGQGVLPPETAGPSYSYPAGTLTYNTSGHANELVSLHARGAGAAAAFSGLAGADYPVTSIIENSAIYEAMAIFLGLR